MEPSSQSTEGASPSKRHTRWLIVLSVINTMPEQTLRAFADHGELGPPLDTRLDEAERALAAAADADLDLPTMTAELEREGDQSFCDSYGELLACIETKIGKLVTGSVARTGAASAETAMRAMPGAG